MHKKEIVTNSLDNLDEILNIEALSKLFKNSLDRSIFISEYMCFGNDGNDVFYEDFIEKHIYNNRSKAQEDSIELTISLNYYNENHFSIIKAIIYSRRSEWLKLLCLDWIFNFKKNLPLSEFEIVNHYILNRSNEELVRTQALLNLLLVEQNIEIFSKLRDNITDAKYGTIYYRILNFLKSKSVNQKVINEISHEVILIINSNNKLEESQKQELLNEFGLIRHQ